jgi:hypothetical protein
VPHPTTPPLTCIAQSHTHTPSHQGLATSEWISDYARLQAGHEDQARVWRIQTEVCSHAPHTHTHTREPTHPPPHHLTVLFSCSTPSTRPTWRGTTRRCSKDSPQRRRNFCACIKSALDGMCCALPQCGSCTPPRRHSTTQHTTHHKTTQVYLWWIVTPKATEWRISGDNADFASLG